MSVEWGHSGVLRSMDMATVTAPFSIFIAIILYARFANGAAHFDMISEYLVSVGGLSVGGCDGGVWPYVLQDSNLLPLGFHLGDLSISRSL